MKGIRCTRENISYRLDCMQYEKAVEELVEGAKNNVYVGETSRSGRERIKAHLWLFSHKKEACPDTCSKPHKHKTSNSALWLHSKEAHGGSLGIEDWRVTITSSLNRQVTEAVTISSEGLDNLLNSKQEFGANNLSEIGVKKGVFLAGNKKKRKSDEMEAGEESEEAGIAIEKEVLEEGGEKGNKLEKRKEVKKLVKSNLHRNIVVKEKEAEIDSEENIDMDVKVE